MKPLREALREHWRKLALLLVFPGCCAVAYLVYVRSTLLPPCFLHKWTGLCCPGCGMTRASHAMLHGDFITAFTFNPLAILLLPFIAYGMAREALAWAWRKPEWRVRLGVRLSLTLACLIIGYGVLRNLPGFEFLRP